MNGVNDSCVNQTLVVLPGWEYTTKGIRSESQDALMSRKIFSHCPFFIRQKGLHVLKTIDRKVLSAEAQRLLASSCRSLQQKLQLRAFLTGIDDMSSKVTIVRVVQNWVAGF